MRKTKMGSSLAWSGNFTSILFSIISALYRTTLTFWQSLRFGWF